LDLGDLDLELTAHAVTLSLHEGGVAGARRISGGVTADATGREICATALSSREDQLHQGDGCHNDGYVQFCAPDGNKRVRAAIKRIAPTAEKRSERHCDEKESLFFLPVEVDLGSCVERGGAMTDKAWNQVCALARLPQIAGFRQVRFE